MAYVGYTKATVKAILRLFGFLDETDRRTRAFGEALVNEIAQYQTIHATADGSSHSAVAAATAHAAATGASHTYINQPVLTSSSPTFSGLTTTGGRVKIITVVAAATYDLLITDEVLHVTYTGTGAVTSLTLPTAQATNGRMFIIKDAGGGASTYNITIDTEGAETIDGSDTLVLNSDYAAVILYSDGTNWFII